MMFCSVLMTSSGSSSQRKEAVLEDKVYCIGSGLYESERHWMGPWFADCFGGIS
jgi:hypothetical protein